VRTYVVGTFVLIGAALLTFRPGLRADFVSDAWIFLERAQANSLAELVAFVDAQQGGFYRPAVELAFWIQYRMFGLDPLPYHLFALTAHIGAALLVGAIALHTTGRRLAAASALVVVLSVQAHEVVFDVADLHNALGGVLLSGAVLAAIRGTWLLGALLSAALFLVDESGLLVLPLVSLYLVVFRKPLRAVWPIAAMTLVYVTWRLVGGGFGTESRYECEGLLCLAAGAFEYVARYLVRPDPLIDQEVALAFGMGAIAVALLLQPWRWTTWRTVIFGLSWAAGATLFYLLGLYPYIADRFLYVPGMGMALVIGAFVVEGGDRLREGGIVRVAGAVALAAIVTWIVVGALTLHGRGVAWKTAGSRASSIVDSAVSLYPDPPIGAVFVFHNVPHSNVPFFPPGNTGPYVFNNGLPEAMRLGYGRPDLIVLEAPAEPPPGSSVLHLQVSGWTVTPIP
jgi:hypothetical protein